MPFHNPKPRNPDPNQPISPDKVITADQIIKTFENEVIKPILKDAYDSTNIPTRVVRGQTYQCVPSEMLGSNDYFEPVNNIWSELAIRGDIVSVLINITSLFTNIGTFSWVLYETFKDYPAELNVPNITTDILNSLQLIIPPKEVLKSFNTLCFILFKQTFAFFIYSYQTGFVYTDNQCFHQLP